MVEQVLEAFDVVLDYNLSVMKDCQALYDVIVNLLLGMKEVLTAERISVNRCVICSVRLNGL